MATDPQGEGEREYSPSTDEFWPQFWFRICKYAEYLYMLLVFITVLGALNLLAVLIGPQSTGAAVVSAMTFGILGATWLGIIFVLWRCKQLRAPDVDSNDDPPETRRDLVNQRDSESEE